MPLIFRIAERVSHPDGGIKCYTRCFTPIHLVRCCLFMIPVIKLNPLKNISQINNRMLALYCVCTVAWQQHHTWFAYRVRGPSYHGVC